MADNKAKKKIAIITVCSLLLIGMVVGLVIGIHKNNKEDESPAVASSQKAITAICQTTDYQEACEQSLKESGSNTSDPKELVELGFQAAMKYVKEAADNSSAFLQGLESDPRAKAALDNCRELADRSISDLQRSFEKLKDFDITNLDGMLLDLKIWLSGALTYQETCLDGFQDVQGDAGDKMKEALNMGIQLTSNGLAMVAEISTTLESFTLGTGSSRRLLSDHDFDVLGHGDELPGWMDPNRRRLLSAPEQIKPDMVVSQDGRGQFRTINEALQQIPKNSKDTFVLHIKEGVYKEKVLINSSLTHLLIIGDGPTKTRITGNLNFIDGTSTFHTATVAVQGDNFMAINIGIENSAGPEKHQAVALRVSADKAIFYNCHMDGYQDTLYAHTYRQYYRDCQISGTIDFIFGDSAAVFQGCTLLVRKPLSNQQCIVTAQGRKYLRQPTGLVLQNCTFKADPEYYPLRDKLRTYLGRPWKEYSRTIIMESFLDDLIHPEGWLKWNESSYGLKTSFYTEFNNRGPAAPKHQRVKWGGVKELPASRIKRFTPAQFIDGKRWVQSTGVPYVGGFIFPLPQEDPNVHYSPMAPAENKDLGKKMDKDSFVAPSDSAAKDNKAKHKGGSHHKNSSSDHHKENDGDNKDSNASKIPESYIAVAPVTSYSIAAPPEGSIAAPPMAAAPEQVSASPVAAHPVADSNAAPPAGDAAAGDAYAPAPSHEDQHIERMSTVSKLLLRGW